MSQYAQNTVFANLKKEWMSSTPKHLAMYKAFGWKPPKFAHVSLLVDSTHAKLSKRTGSIELAEWRDKEGVFPEVLNNFVSLLGWSHGQKNDVMNMEELIRNVPLPHSHHKLIFNVLRRQV